MSTHLISSTHWLEPLLPERLPDSLLSLADRLPFEAGKLTGLLPAATAVRLGALLRVTNSFYSNLIEGQYTEPMTLAPCAPKRSSKQLTALAVTHIGAQEALERALRRYREMSWADCFAPAFVARIHERLFTGASQAELYVKNGPLLQPGQLRDAAQQNVMVGRHAGPAYSAVTPMLLRMQQVYGQAADPRRQLLAALAYHHRLAWVHPFVDGNGRVIRLLTHLQLFKLGLASPLWSLSRGLARQQSEYYARLANADQSRRGDLDGRGQLTQAGLFEFLHFMLETCLDQMHYIGTALALPHLRPRLEHIVALEPRLINAGVKPAAARALHLLITQGSMSRGDFKVYLGLGERVAIEQLKRLIALGLVHSKTPKARELQPGLPVWFAQLIFPDLHRRFTL